MIKVIQTFSVVVKDLYNVTEMKKKTKKIKKNN